MAATHQQHQQHDTDMSPEQMGAQMMRERHQRNLWANFAVVVLGVLLASNPLVFDYKDTLQTWNDIVFGLLLVVLGFLAISPERVLIRWSICVIGIWLLFAPLAFWSPTPVAYTTETVVGAFAIAFSILVPGMPGMRMLPGPSRPPGWSYNPSTWVQRAPVIAFGLLGFFLARYLTAFQLGYISSAWDPFFGDGTERILNSEVSRAWPISDAGFGAFSYMLESLSGFMGNRQRWRTMPWMVLMFGFLVIPLGITSIILIILQPVMVGTWCTICLATALAMLVMIPLAVDEVVAMGQFMARIRRQGKPFWTNFFKGGTLDVDEDEVDETTSFHSPLPEIGRSSVRGVNIPWTLLVSSFIGVWLMAAPAIFDMTGYAADSNHLVGPLVIVCAVIAMAEPVRSLRFINIPLALWLIVAPWLLSSASTTAVLSNLAAGLALIPLSLPRGEVTQEYAGWERFIR